MPDKKILSVTSIVTSYSKRVKPGITAFNGHVSHHICVYEYDYLVNIKLAIHIIRIVTIIADYVTR